MSSQFVADQQKVVPTVNVTKLTKKKLPMTFSLIDTAYRTVDEILYKK
jgi:hypothetical protein